METRPCRSCRAKASNRVHRNLLQKCIFSKVFRCRVCGQYGYVLRVLPFLPAWSHDYWKVVRRETRIISDLVRRHVDSLSTRGNL